MVNFIIFCLDQILVILIKIIKIYYFILLFLLPLFPFIFKEAISTFFKYVKDLKTLKIEKSLGGAAIDIINTKYIEFCDEYISKLFEIFDDIIENGFVDQSLSKHIIDLEKIRRCYYVYIPENVNTYFEDFQRRLFKIKIDKQSLFQKGVIKDSEKREKIGQFLYENLVGLTDENKGDKSIESLMMKIKETLMIDDIYKIKYDLYKKK